MLITKCPMVPEVSEENVCKITFGVYNVELYLEMLNSIFQSQKSIFKIR